MRLKTFDKSGEQIIGENPNRAMITAAVHSIDWTVDDIVGVIVEIDESNWADGSGSLDPQHGLSMMMEDDGVQHVAESAPDSLDQIIEYLTAYSSNDMKRAYELLYGRPLTDNQLAEIIGKERETQEEGGRFAAVGCLVIMVLAVFAIFFIITQLVR